MYESKYFEIRNVEDDMADEYFEWLDRLEKEVYVDGNHICLKPEGEWEYAISVNQSWTYENILGWVLHLLEKDKAYEPDHIIRFAELAMERLGLQKPGM